MSKGAAAAMPYRAVVIGVSAGGFAALTEIFSHLPVDLPVPVLVVQHLGIGGGGYSVQHLDSCSPLRVKEAEAREAVRPGTVYLAPPDYHLLIEDDETLTLSVEEKVNFARPAIDVLFESASEVYGRRLIGVILTGGNHDGARGVSLIKARGGIVIVQDPATAQARAMPEAALAATTVDYTAPLDTIAGLLTRLTGGING
jgi:two-component system chemotaxis response regulator CheB